MDGESGVTTEGEDVVGEQKGKASQRLRDMDEG